MEDPAPDADRARGRAVLDEPRGDGDVLVRRRSAERVVESAERLLRPRVCQEHTQRIDTATDDRVVDRRDLERVDRRIDGRPREPMPQLPELATPSAACAGLHSELREYARFLDGVPVDVELGDTQAAICDADGVPASVAGREPERENRSRDFCQRLLLRTRAVENLSSRSGAGSAACQGPKFLFLRPQVSLGA